MMPNALAPFGVDAVNKLNIYAHMSGLYLSEYLLLFSPFLI